MTQLIDRRQNSSQNSGKKNTVNRQRFLNRYKRQIKEAVLKAAGNRSITGIAQGEQIIIPAKDIKEPRFVFGEGGQRERIFPGNDNFTTGDRIKRPKQEGASDSGSEASNAGAGEDDFIFQLSREEFLEVYFEDLELPDMIKKQVAQISTLKTTRAGITNNGTPTNINIIRSLRQATGRRIALTSPYQKQLQAAKEKLTELEDIPGSSEEEQQKLRDHIALLTRKILANPFIDPIDLRYNHRVRLPMPTTQAVMFCIMDVSGSMDEPKKDIAKRFFILLYLFLKRNYEKIDLVFIRHHTSAKEVNEEDFFYSRETGGTVVSSALELLNQIIDTRYPPSGWNIYVAQASDGDNWNADSPYCQALLRDKIIPKLQYYAYIEIMPRHHQSLWEVYQLIKKQFPNFSMENIDTIADIYPVFRQLFKRKTA